MIKLTFFSFLFLAFSCHAQTIMKSDTALIKEHMYRLTKTEQYRQYRNVKQLDLTADYILQQFGKYSDSVFLQEYQVGDRTYSNVVCSFGTRHSKRIIVGAHYDVCGDQEGADDNASGVTGLLELARMLHEKPLNYRVDLVAYTLEEPPFFRTELMGSYVHAQYLSDQKIDVYGMVALEMIGFFKDDKKTQDYPIGILKMFYGGRGNYITLVKKMGGDPFTRKFYKAFKKAKTIRTKKFAGPKSLPGIDYSDHRNYWLFGFNACMMTDTSFYRNKNYHQKTDVMETLDFQRMSQVINGMLISLLKMK